MLLPLLQTLPHKVCVLGQHLKDKKDTHEKILVKNFITKIREQAPLCTCFLKLYLGYMLEFVMKYFCSSFESVLLFQRFVFVLFLLQNVENMQIFPRL